MQKFYFFVFVKIDLTQLTWWLKVMSNSTLVCRYLLIFIQPSENITLREKCPYSELFWSAFSRIRTEYGKILRMSRYSVQMWKNSDQNNSKYGLFLRSVRQNYEFFKEQTHLRKSFEIYCQNRPH